MNHRIEKLYRQVANKGVDAVLITSDISINYLTSYFYDFEIGSSPFQLIPAALLITAPDKSFLIIADNETYNLPDSETGIIVKPYLSYTFKKSLDYANQFLLQLNDSIRQSGKRIRNIGIEPGSVSYIVTRDLQSRLNQIIFSDITDDLKQLRMVKDTIELDAIRAAVHLSDVGQQAVINYARPRMSELELFTLVRGEMEKAAGKRIPVMADLVSGFRTFEGGGNPSVKLLEEGDLVMSDLTPCLNGYWGDTCNTMVIGKPTAAQINDFNRISDALTICIEAVKPGIPVNTIDQIMREFLAPAGEYNHHSGHGVGVENHEEPRVTPYNQILLEPDMVIALEPGVYRNGYGIRLEHMVVVTTKGCEILSEFKHQFISA